MCNPHTLFRGEFVSVAQFRNGIISAKVIIITCMKAIKQHQYIHWVFATFIPFCNHWFCNVLLGHHSREQIPQNLGESNTILYYLNKYDCYCSITAQWINARRKMPQKIYAQKFAGLRQTLAGARQKLVRWNLCTILRCVYLFIISLFLFLLVPSSLSLHNLPLCFLKKRYWNWEINGILFHTTARTCWSCFSF